VEELCLLVMALEDLLPELGFTSEEGLWRVQSIHD
jgi:hypothetical protein